MKRFLFYLVSLLFLFFNDSLYSNTEDKVYFDYKIEDQFYKGSFDYSVISQFGNTSRVKHDLHKFLGFDFTAEGPNYVIVQLSNLSLEHSLHEINSYININISKTVSTYGFEQPYVKDEKLAKNTKAQVVFPVLNSYKTGIGAFTIYLELYINNKSVNDTILINKSYAIKFPIETENAHSRPVLNQKAEKDINHTVQPKEEIASKESKSISFAYKNNENQSLWINSNTASKDSGSIHLIKKSTMEIDSQTLLLNCEKIFIQAITEDTPYLYERYLKRCSGLDTLQDASIRKHLAQLEMFADPSKSYLMLPKTTIQFLTFLTGIAFLFLIWRGTK